MAAAEIRAAWHRTAATCYLLHEDSKRNPKVGQPPSEASEKAAKLEQQVLGKFDENQTHLFGMAEGWNTINSNYFMDRKLEFHFQPTDIEAEKKLSDIVDSEGSKVQSVEGSSVENGENPGRSKEETGSYKAHQNIDCVSMGWRNANKGELAALIAKKSSEDMENCDLPSSLHGKVDIRRNRDKVVRSMLQPRETSPSTPLHFSVVPSSDEQYSKKQRQDQSEPELPHWTSLVPEGKSELLGEALCRSQTRAREAEKRAAEAVTEKERLLKLFFREASITFTYKHWVKFLEAENRLLKLRAGGDEVSISDKQVDFVSFQQDGRFDKGSLLKECSCVKGGELTKCTRLKKRKYSSSDHSVAVLGCTVGLAFALGVGLAGAGLFFGCTMGWILIAF